MSTVSETRYSLLSRRIRTQKELPPNELVPCVSSKRDTIWPQRNALRLCTKHKLFNHSAAHDVTFYAENNEQHLLSPLSVTRSQLSLIRSNKLTSEQGGFSMTWFLPSVRSLTEAKVEWNKTRLRVGSILQPLNCIQNTITIRLGRYVLNLKCLMEYSHPGPPIVVRFWIIHLGSNRPLPRKCKWAIVEMQGCLRGPVKCGTRGVP